MGDAALSGKQVIPRIVSCTRVLMLPPTPHTYAPTLMLARMAFESPGASV